MTHHTTRTIHIGRKRIYRNGGMNPKQDSRSFTLFTVISDSTWALGSILLLVLPLFNFAADAKWAIGVTAICVDFFATFQFLQWRKM